MPELAEVQVQRLVALVAWMSQRDIGKPVRYRDAARQIGVSEAVLRADLQVLLDLTDSYKPWLGSLSVMITADGFLLASRGAFRRPFRLSRDEALSLIVGLVAVRGGRELAGRLGREFDATPDAGEVERAWALGPTPGERVAQILGVARRARDQHRKLDLVYCGSAGEPTRRVVHPYQIVQAGGIWYLVAWCEKAGEGRRFRAERILEIRELPEPFQPRSEMERVRGTRDLLSAEGAPSAAVAFSAAIARWVRERYPAGKDLPDGRYQVQFPVADPHWLAREVLQYGAEAEILAPEGMRELVRGMLG
jgi:predicted DNA-binding transcriptional regulator YafY